MGVITDNLDLWGEAIRGTLILFFGGGLLALVVGLLIGAMRVSPIPIARTVGAVYVNDANERFYAPAPGRSILVGVNAGFAFH